MGIKLRKILKKFKNQKNIPKLFLMKNCKYILYIKVVNILIFFLHNVYMCKNESILEE